MFLKLDDEWEDDDGESSTSSDGQLEAAGSREDISVEEDSNNLTLPSEVFIRSTVLKAEMNISQEKALQLL